MSNGIEGKVVVITGASSGLGDATARHDANRHAGFGIDWRQARNDLGLALQPRSALMCSKSQ